MLSKMNLLLTVNVAEMHYIHDMDHDEIAEKLGITPFEVSRILDEAVELGIVEVKIRCFA